MSTSETLSSGPVQAFHREDWIGSGRKWPLDAADVPDGLWNIYWQSLAVPPTHGKETMYQHTETVTRFLSTTVAQQANDITYREVSTYFSASPPTTTITRGDTTRIPAPAVLAAMRKHFGQALLDGACSILDPAKTSQRYDLWVLQYWLNLQDILRLQQSWRQSREWLVQQRYDPISQISFDTALSWLDSVACDGPTEAFEAVDVRTSAFRVFLSNDWLSDDHINMMIAQIRQRIQASEEIRKSVVVTDLWFTDAIQRASAADTYNTSSPAVLRRLEDQLKASPMSELYAPAFVAQYSHWIVLRVNFARYEYCYGDSLGHQLPRPKQLMEKLGWWLKARFRHAFKDLGRQLDVGRQNDSFSCGISAINAITHHVFGDSLWTDMKKSVHRLRWFNIMCAEDAARKESRRFVSAQRMDISRILNPGDLDESLKPISASDSEVQVQSLAVPCDIHCSDMPQVKEESAGLGTRKRFLEDEDSKCLATKSKSTTTELGKPLPRAHTTTKKRRVDVAEGDTAALPPPALGVSRSNRAAVAQNHAIRIGSFAADLSKLAAWKSRVKEIDDCVEFPLPDHGVVVRHIPCGKEVRMKNPYNTAHWQRHTTSCRNRLLAGKVRNPTAGMKTLTTLLTEGKFTIIPPAKDAVKPAASPVPMGTLPCPGLSAQQYSDVASYLRRSGALGGGARSVSVIARKTYKKEFAQLLPKQKEQVRLVQRHEWRWRNDHACGRVFATEACRKVVSVAQASLSSSIASPCDGCLSLLSMKVFKNVIRIPTPLDDNRKFTNKPYTNKELAKLYGKIKNLRAIIEHPDPTHSPFVRFAMGALDGSIKNEIFIGIVQTLMLKQDKIMRGVGMQNFKYAPAYDEFMHIVHIHSPKAYRFMSEHLPARTERSIRYNEALQPRFPLGISARTFEHVVAQLNMLEYSGPVALSCDDTKLSTALDPVYDKATDAYYILGGVGQPLKVADPESFASNMANGDVEKAEKIRLWIIQIPLPQVAPIILAAMGISNKTSARTLWNYHELLLTGLCERGVNVVSSAADGATVERSVQHYIETTATHHIPYSVQHPSSPHLRISFSVPCFGPTQQPIVPIQDSRHALKTIRNHVYNGRRFIIVGNEPVLFAHARILGLVEDGPLYRRDVEKVDRQDDNAATRLFSADALEWLSSHDEEKYRGTVLFLFVFGELVDAYQNRHLPHIERMKMAFRAMFFLDLWEKHLRAAGYARSDHFLSPQASDILRTVCRAIIQLIFLFRDHLNGRYPLVPWLLTTEPCEHLFGLCRQIVEDFNMLDFYYMVPKLFVRLREAVFNQYHGNEKATASGYHHTYTDSRSVDLSILRQFPSDDAINEAARTSYEETISLFGLVGVSANELITLSQADPATHSMFWTAFSSGSTPSPQPTDADMFNDAGSDSEEDNDDDGDEEDTGTALHHLLSELERMEFDSPLTEEEVMKLTHAAIALTVDTRFQINALPELDQENMTEILSEAAAAIAAQLQVDFCDLTAAETAGQPSDDGSDPLNCVSSDDLAAMDSTELLRLRRLHQTKQAADGVRLRCAGNKSTTDFGHRVHSARQQLIKKLVDIIKMEGDSSSRKGSSRIARWTTSAATPRANGNTANAEQAAKSRASKLLKKRRELYARFVPAIPALQEGRVSPISPLTAGPDGVEPSTNQRPTSYAFILVDGKVQLGRVLSVYSKGGGKNGKYGWVPKVDSITAASYIPVQVYEYTFGRRFCATTQMGLMQGRKKTYAFIQPSAFLCSTHASPRVVASDVEASPEDMGDFRTLRKVESVLRDVVATLRKAPRRKRAGAAGDTDTDAEESE